MIPWRLSHVVAAPDESQQRTLHRQYNGNTVPLKRNARLMGRLQLVRQTDGKPRGWLVKLNPVRRFGLPSEPLAPVNV